MLWAAQILGTYIGFQTLRISLRATTNNNWRLYDVDFMLPDNESINRFANIIRRIEEKRLINAVQIRTIEIEKLRDTLLPKLMSGEVRVKVA